MKLYWIVLLSWSIPKFVLAQLGGGLDLVSNNTESNTLENPGTLVNAEDLKTVSLQVRDLDEQDIVPYYTVDLSSCRHAVYESNETGKFTMQIPQDFSCYITISKVGFSSLQLYINYDEINSESKLYKVFLSRSPNYFSGRVQANGVTKNYIPGVYVEALDMDRGESQIVKSDEKGEYALYLKPLSHYKFTFSHPEFQIHHKTIMTRRDIEKNILGKTFMTTTLPESDLFNGGLMVSRKIRSSYRVYSIQVTATSYPPPTLESFERDLGSFGKVFTQEKDGITRIKVGLFQERQTAEQVLAKVKRIRKYSDAFLTKAIYKDSETTVEELEPAEKEQKEPKGYAIRLASYLNPAMFNPVKVQKIAPIQKIEKDEWTIMLLTGFDSLDDAKKARQEAIEAGFRGAQIITHSP